MSYLSRVSKSVVDEVGRNGEVTSLRPIHRKPLLGAGDPTRRTAAWVVILLTVGFLAPRAAAQKTGTVVGQVVDAQTDGTLPGATVRVGETGFGTAADLQGRFRLSGIPAGTTTLVVSYVGYNTREVPVDVPPGGRLDVDIALEAEVVRGQEVIVTAQLVGQAQAINSQLSANTIVNVVAPERIQELPDQNAAEAVGRLPGIAVQRDAGEGTKVVIRGLSPKFSAITVNGERIPSTDSEDRSVDLSMISPDVLAGIEVFKALTPDKDADAIGGSVNFVVRKAPDGRKGSILLQTGYSDHENKYGQFKGSASISDRFLDKRFGVLLTGSAQQADRSSDVFDAEYEFIRGPREGEEHALLNVAKLNLADRLETRDRYSASATMDYQLTHGGLLLNAFWGRTNRDEVRRRKRYRVGDGRTEYELRDQNIDITLLTNSLSGWHHLGPFDVEWRTSLSKTNRHVPFSHTARFQELAAFNNDLIDDQGPELIPDGAKLNLDETWFQFANQATEKVDDQNITGQLDLTYRFNVGPSIQGLIKTGAKYRDKNRDRNRNELQTPFAEVDEIGQEHPDLYNLDDEGHIKFENFVDPGFDAGEFLGGAYDFGPGLDAGLLRDFWQTYKSRYGVNRFALLDNYDAGETVSAAYLMTQVNVSNRFMLLPGLRIEHTTTDYDAFIGNLRQDLGRTGTISDTTGGQKYDEFLPMLHARYKITSRIDVRAAVTKSLSRPDYFNLVPFIRISPSELTIAEGNPDLKHTKAWNYDLYTSVYSRLGLFTLGVFYKTLDDIDYLRQSRITEGEFESYTITSPVNGQRSTVKGIEVDLQTNFLMLPEPFSSVVLNANYSFSDSETFFPFLKIGGRSPDPPFRPIVIDTVRAATIPGQARHVANVSLGYEKGGFSGRISFQYQDQALVFVGSRPELDGYTDDLRRWDLSVSQELASGLDVILTVNNLTNNPERAFLGIETLPTNEQIFGWSMDLGVKYKF